MFYRLRRLYYHTNEESTRVNVAHDLLNSLAVFIPHDQHDAITETLTQFFLLACQFHFLASFVRQWHQKDLIVLKKTRHGAKYPFFKGLEFPCDLILFVKLVIKDQSLQWLKNKKVEKKLRLCEIIFSCKIKARRLSIFAANEKTYHYTWKLYRCLRKYKMN